MLLNSDILFLSRPGGCSNGGTEVAGEEGRHEEEDISASAIVLHQDFCVFFCFFCFV